MILLRRFRLATHPEEREERVSCRYGMSAHLCGHFLRPVSVANIQCGSFSLPWEMFRHAFNGRQLLAFQISRQGETQGTSDAVSTVRDARERYWDENYTDLAATMALFTFFKAKN